MSFISGLNRRSNSLDKVMFLGHLNLLVSIPSTVTLRTLSFSGITHPGWQDWKAFWFSLASTARSRNILLAEADSPVLLQFLEIWTLCVLPFKPEMVDLVPFLPVVGPKEGAIWGSGWQALDPCQTQLQQFFQTGVWWQAFHLWTLLCLSKWWSI